MGVKLQSGQTVFIDTAPLIYFIEENDRYIESLTEFFDAVTRLDIMLVTSMITYIEILSLPEKQGQAKLAARYREFLTNSEQLSIYPLTVPVAEAAIRFRAHEGLRTPDAIQLATALVCGADFVLTNDRAWRKIHTPRVVIINEL